MCVCVCVCMCVCVRQHFQQSQRWRIIEERLNEFISIIKGCFLFICNLHLYGNVDFHCVLWEFVSVVVLCFFVCMGNKCEWYSNNWLP